MEYETQQRSHDWIAHIKGHPEMWESGATEAEAVEKLRVSRGNLTTRAADLAVRAAIEDMLDNGELEEVGRIDAE